MPSGCPGEGKRKGTTSEVDLGRDGLHFGQRLQPALSLPRLGGLGPEALDEGFHLAALVVLALLQLELQALLLAARLLEAVVTAGIEGQPALGKMQDAVHRIVQEIAIVAYDQHGVRIALDEVFQPERAFKVEIVRRLVEQQDVRRGEQRASQRDPHAPAAGEFRAGPGLRCFVEAKP